MAEAKPEIGEQIHYYDPSLLKKVGYGRGHEGRGVGPYVALVTNDIGAGLTLCLFLPAQPPFSVKALDHKDKAKPDNPYWDWTDPLQKARAVKRLAEKPLEPEPPKRDTTKHPSRV